MSDDYCDIILLAADLFFPLVACGDGSSGPWRFDYLGVARALSFGRDTQGCLLHARQLTIWSQVWLDAVGDDFLVEEIVSHTICGKNNDIVVPDRV